MLRIDCPFCGLRDETEFTYGGDAGRVRPSQEEIDETIWNNYVFFRNNPRGAHREYWFHQHGCRAWLKVTRDMVSHEIAAVSFADDKDGA